MRAFQIAHKNYCDFFTNNIWDEEKAVEKLKVKKKSKETGFIVDERAEIIHRFYECLLNSKMMNELGRLYITHSNISVRDTVKLYNNELPVNKQLNENTGKSKIISCANKVNNSFEKIIYHTKTEGKQIREPLDLIMDDGVFGPDKQRAVREAIAQINKFIDLFDTTKKNLKQQTVIKIPAYAKVSNLSEDRFNEFMDIIRPYSQREMGIVEAQIKQMKEEVGYYNFLLTPGVKLTEEDKERRDTILRWLSMEKTEENTTKEESVEDFDFNDDVIF